MSIADGTGLIEWEGMLFEPGSDLLARTRWVFNYVREHGGTIEGNEAGRPFGVYSDRFALNASDTASGISTVNFQWGRKLRGETPSAADPAGGIYASDHTKGIATDTNCNDLALRREAMALVGMEQTIDDETWHFAIRSAPQVDLTGWADLGSTPFDNGDDMFSEEDRYALNIVLGAMGRVEIGTYAANQKADAALGKLDIIKWATTDDSGGLRRMVADVQNAVAKLKPGATLTAADIDAITKTIADIPLDDIKATAAATADEIDRRALERLSADKKSSITELAARDSK